MAGLLALALLAGACGGDDDAVARRVGHGARTSDTAGGQEQVARDREAFCERFDRVATPGPLTPDELEPLLQDTVEVAPAEIAAEARAWAALALGVTEAFAEAGATPDQPRPLDDVRALLSDDELEYLDATIAAGGTGRSPAGPAGAVLGYVAEHCPPGG